MELTDKDTQFIDEMMNDTADNSYQERNSVRNRAEDIFEEFALGINHTIYRLGFNEKKANVEFFYTLEPWIRSLPDYVHTTQDNATYYHVKGTTKVKLIDLKEYSDFESKLKERNSLKMVFAFPTLIYITDIREVVRATEGTQVNRYKDSGHEYYTVDFSKTRHILFTYASGKWVRKVDNR